MSCRQGLQKRSRAWRRGAKITGALIPWLSCTDGCTRITYVMQWRGSMSTASQLKWIPSCWLLIDMIPARLNLDFDFLSAGTFPPLNRSSYIHSHCTHVSSLTDMKVVIYALYNCFAGSLQ